MTPAGIANSSGEGLAKNCDFLVQFGQILLPAVQQAL
jgi:hypothetical protein